MCFLLFCISPVSIVSADDSEPTVVVSTPIPDQNNGSNVGTGSGSDDVEFTSTPEPENATPTALVDSTDAPTVEPTQETTDSPAVTSTPVVDETLTETAEPSPSTTPSDNNNDQQSDRPVTTSEPTDQIQTVSDLSLPLPSSENNQVVEAGEEATTVIDPWFNGVGGPYNYVTIQAAINGLKAYISTNNALPTGGIVYIESGTFDEDVSISGLNYGSGSLTFYGGCQAGISDILFCTGTSTINKTMAISNSSLEMIFKNINILGLITLSGAGNVTLELPGTSGNDAYTVTTSGMNKAKIKLSGNDGTDSTYIKWSGLCDRVAHCWNLCW